MDKRLVFDSIPEQFDKWRVRYNPALFSYIKEICKLTKNKSCLEIGPGTGQASDFAIQSGCDYLAIELGENLTEKMKEKYSSYDNFHIVNADFETYDFGNKKFDLIYSAAAIQWIDEDIAYRRVYDLLKDGGILAMLLMRSEYQSDNPALYDEIQLVYDNYFVTEQPYTQKFDYMNGINYGLTFIEEKSFPGKRVYDAKEHNEYLGTHSTHIRLKEEYKDLFYNGVREAVIKHGNKIVFNDDYVVYLYKKYK
ncbi:MAG: class I SAM-dependent methyltransferase [Lachnospiraceae bacterium]|nr:class I SAM-dependent methyltransferase [Lachnospiraceae bacterium]